MTFGLFSGFSAVFALLINNQFGGEAGEDSWRGGAECVGEAGHLLCPHPLPAERQLAGHRPLVRGRPGGTLPQRLGAGPAPGQRPGAGERAQVAAVLQHEKKK